MYITGAFTRSQNITAILLSYRAFVRFRFTCIGADKCRNEISYTAKWGKVGVFVVFFSSSLVTLQYSSWKEIPVIFTIVFGWLRTKNRPPTSLRSYQCISCHIRFILGVAYLFCKNLNWIILTILHRSQWLKMRN